ncbi:hypothetical protein BY996DRAFT_6465296 [Phakopsora pachyrhizi]|nr:hypothetical protein BY996DRAFT_6465296 [Phakopsora pachyrhizi]
MIRGGISQIDIELMECIVIDSGICNCSYDLGWYNSIKDSSYHLESSDLAKIELILTLMYPQSLFHS